VKQNYRYYKKNNNKKVRIIFILTHSTINPYDHLNIKKAYKKIGLIKSDISKIINNITSSIGCSYSYNKDYF